MHVFEQMKQYLGDFYNPVMMGLKIIAILLISAITIRLGRFIIRKVFEKQKSFKFRMNDKKIDTMSTMMVSILRYAVYIIAIVIILSDVFKMQSILAAAGIGGIAVGLGAQSLIKDIISGFFIVMEDQYVVGDLVTIENMNGTVEEMELRVTRLRNFNGDLYIIPNGEIKKVTNHTRGSKAIIVDIPVAYSADMEKAFKVARIVCEEITGLCDVIVEEPNVIGITELGKDHVNIRIMGKSKPNEQWQVERQIRKLVKEGFDREGIEFFDRNRLFADIDGKGGTKDAR